MIVLNDFTHDARVHKEARALAKVGHDVTVIALWRADLAAQETQAGYEVRRLRLYSRTWRGRLVAPLVKYLEFALQVWRLAGHERADIYQANDANTLPAAWIAAQRSRACLVYDAHELETGRNFGSSQLAGFYRHMWAWPERALIRHADAVMTVSGGIADELVRLYAIHRPLVVLNCPEQQMPTPSTRLRDELGIPSDLRIALYQGGIAAGRGLESFLEAVQQLPDVAAVLLGNGPLLPAFRARAESGAWQRVYLPGAVPLADLPSYTASADVGISLIQGVCRSYRLALPNKLFEYVQAGIPVVASNLPEIARVVHEHGLGVTVDPEDPGAIAGGIQLVLHDAGRYAQAQAGARQAAFVLNWEQESIKLVALYRQLGHADGLPVS
jgi:glycosyltransferase involved in cell wall biosynthesis